MRRYLSLSKSSGAARKESAVATDSEKIPLATNAAENTDQSTVASTIRATPLPSPNLKVKKVDHYYSRWSKKWKYENSGSNAIPEIRSAPLEGKDDPWQGFCFVVVREIPNEVDREPYFRVIVKSPYLLKACKDVIAEVPGISWIAIPLQLDPHLLLAFLPRFTAYRDNIQAKGHISEEDSHVLSTVNVLIDYLRNDYRATIASIENLTSHGEISFDLLYAILVPRSILIITCPVTGEPQALQLVMAVKTRTPAGHIYSLLCEGIDEGDSDAPNARTFMKTQTRIILPPFEGTIKISSLEAYPIQFHPREKELRSSLIARGQKWSNLTGVHHMYYKGTGVFKCQGRLIKYNLDSRVMIDRANFKRLNPNYSFPKAKPETIQQDQQDSDDEVPPPPPPRHLPFNPHAPIPMSPASVPIQPQYKKRQPVLNLTDDELLLASPVLWGFSLSDKLWLELNVEKVGPVEWDEEAFANLVLPPDRKALLQSLVEAHNAELGFDDFIKGKGRGLVVNLFGPPGVGKTLSAEATSEHVKRPLYVVGAGDLGTTAAELDQHLQRVFDLATAWRAIVLIDEADVFLEERSLHDLERNAMVAVFLRHIEYYPAILFLTTNRVKTFDGAFLSRIHIALHFHALSKTAQAQVWTAFLNKAGVQIGKNGSVSEEELMKLTERDINGRQVKNATKTASSLASSRGETLTFKHLVEVLDVMEHFSKEFENLKASA